jgi:hypothetical protein
MLDCEALLKSRPGTAAHFSAETNVAQKLDHRGIDVRLAVGVYEETLLTVGNNFRGTAEVACDDWTPGSHRLNRN